MWDIARQMRALKEENKKFQEERDLLREAIEELEHENEALKLRGQKDIAEILRRDEALGKAQEAIDRAGQEVQRQESMCQDVRAEAEKHELEVERLRQQVANQDRRNAEQAALIDEQSAELQWAEIHEDRSGIDGASPQRRRLTALRDEAARRERQALMAQLEAKRSVVSLSRVSGSENKMRGDMSRQELRLFSDLKGVVEPPVLVSMEAMELSWQEFKRLL